MTRRSRPTFRAILEAAGAKCGKCESRDKLTVNHIVPLASGGSNEAFNLEILCEDCHRKDHGIDKKKRDFK